MPSSVLVCVFYYELVIYNRTRIYRTQLYRISAKSDTFFDPDGQNSLKYSQLYRSLDISKNFVRSGPIYPRFTVYIAVCHAMEYTAVCDGVTCTVVCHAMAN